MERLRQSALERVQVFLEETSAPCDLSTFGGMVLPAVQKLIPSVVACYAQIDASQAKLVRQETFPSTAPFNGDSFGRVFELHMFDHPVFQHWSHSGNSVALRTSDFLIRREWHRFGLYREVYRHLGTEDSLAIGLPAPPGLIACICNERDTNFTDEERLLLEIVRPHLAQAYRSAELFSLLGNASDQGGLCTMVIDRHGRPLLAPEATWRLIEEYFPGGRPLEWTLPETISNWLGRQLSRFGRDYEVPPPASPLVVQRPNGRSLTLRLVLGHLTGEQALLVFQERQPSALETVSAELGLTSREEEVLREAARGLSSADIAQSLYISRRTVEKHLENIYGKLGVDSRSAAVARALFFGDLPAHRRDS